MTSIRVALVSGLLLCLSPLAPALAADDPKSPRLPDTFTLTLKGSHFWMLDETQTTHRQEWVFDDTVTYFRALEGEGRLPFLGRRIAVGGEYLEFRTTVKRAGTGETYTERLRGGFLKAKYFLSGSQTFAPYVGLGLGTVRMPDDGDSGPIETGSDGTASMGFAGVQWRGRHVGLRAELLHLDTTDLTDNSNEELDMSGVALTLGLSFFF